MLLLSINQNVTGVQIIKKQQLMVIFIVFLPFDKTFSYSNIS